jgi:hypothetical protein
VRNDDIERLVGGAEDFDLGFLVVVSEPQDEDEVVDLLALEADTFAFLDLEGKYGIPFKGGTPEYRKEYARRKRMGLLTPGGDGGSGETKPPKEDGGGGGGSKKVSEPSAAPAPEAAPAAKAEGGGAPALLTKGSKETFRENFNAQREFARSVGFADVSIDHKTSYERAASITREAALTRQQMGEEYDMPAGIRLHIEKGGATKGGSYSPNANRLVLNSNVMAGTNNAAIAFHAAGDKAGWFSGPSSSAHIIAHELGHAAHWKSGGGSFGPSTWNAASASIALKVSRYGSRTGAEFVAETIAGRHVGKSYPKDVMDLYAAYRGPVRKGKP